MKKLKRPPCPGELANNYVEWTKRFESAKDASDFFWPGTVRKQILDALEEMSAGHCSFCESYPLDMSNEQSSTSDQNQNFVHVRTNGQIFITSAAGAMRTKDRVE